MDILKQTALSVCVIAAMGASAATKVQLHAKDFNLLKSQFNLGSHALAMGANALVKVNAHKDFNGTVHTRYQQTFQGVKVLGGQALTHAKQGLLASSQVSGEFYQNLTNDLGAKPVSTGDKALQSQIALYKGNKISQKQSELTVYVDAANKAHWAYQVSFLAESGKAIPKRPTAIIDADTLKPYIQFDDIKTSKVSVKGKGYGGNTRTGKYEYGNELSALDITRDATKARCYLENTQVKTIDMDHGSYSDGRAMSFPCPDDANVGDNTYWTGSNEDGYDEINGAYSPTDDAHYAGYVIKHMYKDWYDLEALVNKDGSPMQLIMRVHYGNSYQNAFWDGSQMTFGDGGSMMYPLVSLGVGAHEVSHGFTQQHSNLMYWGQSGGINESFSDMAAQAAEFYSTGVASWYVGERIMKEDSGYDVLRYMETPSRDGRSIDSADDYYSGLDVHYSSGVYNRLFFLIANSEGWTARKTFDVMVKANQDYWTSWADYKTAACGVLSAANDYAQKDASYKVSDVKTALDTVAVDYSSCS